ncbi:MAG TPA: hypothetical protein ENK52_04350 [Saprospiraceae bacterium]|nr:hypothetical protein [Saprospiraceae bacterium]
MGDGVLEVRSWKSEVRSWESEVGSLKSEVTITSDFRLLASSFLIQLIYLIGVSFRKCDKTADKKEAIRCW